MNYEPILKQLYDERSKLDRAIEQLEKLENASSEDGGPKRRGRKSMGPEERKAVSERIKKYWAAKRREKK